MLINFIKFVLVISIMPFTINTMKLMNQLTIKCLRINSACECTKSGADLGIVHCDQNLKLASLNNQFFYSSKNSTNDKLSIYNQLSIYKITFKQNGIRQLHNLTFQRTGIYNLEIIQQNLVFLPNRVFFGLERTLRTLSLESNQLINVPTLALTGLRKLTHLNLNRNRIRKLISDQLFPVSIQNTLKTLLIAHNHLAHIDAFTFSGLISLQHLDLSSNHLIFINDCSFCTSSLISSSKLLYLNLASNRLSLIPFTLISSLTSLRVLDLADNLIETLDDYSDNELAMKQNSFKDNLKDFFEDDHHYDVISFNHQSPKTSTSKANICLEYLNLENNQLTKLTNQSFVKFKCLKILNLASNQIKSIDDNTFKNVDISQLNLRNCKLVKLTSGVWNGVLNQLTHLDLSENMLDYQQNDTTLPFIGLEKLTSFKFNGNIGKFHYLNPLSLAQSQYSLMEFEFTQSNEHSYNDNYLSSTPVYHSSTHYQLKNEQFNPVNYEIEFKNLRRLSITFFDRPSSNGIQNKLEKKQLLSYGDYNLHYLDLSRSWLEDLNDKELFESTPWLLHLNLSSNHIKRLNANIFKPLSNSLISLDLNSAFQLAYIFDCDLFKHLNSLRSLSLIENNIHQFKDQSTCFDQLTELRLLQLDFNYLTSLKPNQFEQLKSLVHLTLSNNQLQSLESNTFSELPKLVFIDLSFNSIKTIKQSAINDLISLRHINLANNQLRSLEQDAFINLPNLEYINFNKNQLKQFNWNIFFDQIGALSNTLRFDLKSNRLITLNFNVQNPIISSNNNNSSKMFNYNFVANNNQLTMNFIEIIDLTNNQLIEIEFNNFQIIRNSLIRIHLDHNRLRKLNKQAFANLPHLQYLSLSSNFLTSVPDDLLIDDYSLQKIDFSSNLLMNLPSKLFIHNFQLTIIDLRNNLIKKLPNNLFANCSQLEQLYLDHNSLREFPVNTFTNRNMNSIKVISLAFNYIEHLNLLAIDIYRNLIYLNLSHNSIKQFDSSSFVSLIELDLSFNKFQFDEIENLFANFYSTRMINVDLSNTGLRQAPVLNLPALISLNLANNFLTFIYSHSFVHIEHLHKLNLSNNRLTNVPNNLFNQKLGETLIELDISFNPIYTLNNDSFIGLRKLEKLCIHGLHRLHFIQLGVFQSLKLLQELSLSYYEHQISSLCHLSAISKLNIESLIVHFDQQTSSSSFDRKFLYDSSLCRNLNKNGLGRKLERIHFIGPLIKHIDRNVFNEFTNSRLTLRFTNTSIKHLVLDLSNSIQTLNLHLDRSFQSNLEINRIGSKQNSNKKIQLKTITFDSSTELNCDCRTSWIKDHWKKVNFEVLNNIAKWFSIDSLNEKHHFYHLEEKESTTNKFNKNQLDDLFIKQNLTYEQLIELNLNRILNLEQNLEQVKCKEQNEQPDNDLFLVKDINEKFDHHHFNNNKFNLNYLNKIEKRKNERKQSILDAFQSTMKTCIRSLTNNSNNLFNEINYLKYFGGSFLVNFIICQNLVFTY